MVIVSPYDQAWPDRFAEAPDLGAVPPDLFDGWEE
jgi:hypothetical protein